MEIKIMNRSGNQLPGYQSVQAAGMDLHASLSGEVILKPLQRAVIPTGLFIELPEGYEAQVRPRSGLAARHGITVLNTPGTVDADYRGEIMVILVNLSQTTYTVHHGDRIAQMVIARYEKAEWVPADKLKNSDRETGGFGSTGF